MLKRILFCTAALLSAAACALAQTPAKPDSPEVIAHLEKARALAGTLWAPAYQFFCVAPRANSNDDPPIEPARIFDNVYIIGNTGTVVYAVDTPEGIILIDALAANQVESVLLPGMRKLGLDPARVKLVVVAHGHPDHFGGSPYFQDRGARVAMSAEDWNTIAPRPGAAAKGAAPPKRDIEMKEGQPVGLGGVEITPVLIPGHTPGSMGFIFPVRDNGKIFIAGMFGGTMLTFTRPTLDQLSQYQDSIAHFRAEAVKAGVEIELQNHPLMDDLTGRLAAVRAHGSGAPNPFIEGRENYPAFLDVMAECLRAQIARRTEP